MQTPESSNVSKPKDNETLSAEAEADEAIKSLAVEVRALRADQEALRRENEEHFRFLASSLAGSQHRHAAARSSPRRSSPIFVLGCPRSGTTAMGMALKAAGFPGWREGHVFPLLKALHEKLDWFFENSSFVSGYGNGIDYFDKHYIAEILVDYFENVHTSNHLSSYWVDKTPGPQMIEAAPLLFSIWPSAKFIFCYRRGIENVESQLRRFANEPGVHRNFKEACLAWTNSMETWTKVRKTLRRAFVEVDQADMTKRPDQVATKVTSLLRLAPWQTSAFYRSLTESSPERTATNFETKSLDQTSWTKEEQLFFSEVCGPAMQSYGYKLGGVADATLKSALYIPFTKDPSKALLQNVDGKNYVQAEHGAFMLHPRLDGQPPTVTYLSLPFKGHSRFFSTLEIRHPQSEPVCYRLRIHGSEGGAALVDEHCIVEPGGVRTWSVDFPPLEGAMNVSISTDMAPGAKSHFYAWAHWIGPRFLVK